MEKINIQLSTKGKAENPTEFLDMERKMKKLQKKFNKVS